MLIKPGILGELPQSAALPPLVRFGQVSKVDRYGFHIYPQMARSIHLWLHLASQIDVHITLGAMSIANLRIEGGSAEFGESGISLVPWFTRRAVHIPWANVTFVSPVPGVRYNGGDWRTFRGEPLSKETIGRSIEFYAFEVALNERQALLVGKNFFVKMWLRTSIWFKPLFTADDKPHPNNGCIQLCLPKRWVRKNGIEIMSALEAIKKYSRFGLLVSG